MKKLPPEPVDERPIGKALDGIGSPVIRIPITDGCEERVIAKIKERQQLGLSKYGTTMERQDLSESEWLTHAQEEAMDLAIYLERLIASAKEFERLSDL